MKLFLKCLTLMTLLSLFCCAFVCAEASGDPDVTVIASGECGAAGDNLTWSLASNGQLTVSGTGEMQDFEDTPAPWSGYASSISSLVIQNGVETIGVSAFAGLGQLQNAVIPDSITVIGREAFASCGSLLGIAFPESQLRIEAQAFQSCNALTSVTLPAGLQRVEPDAFESCRNLTSITIDEGNAAYNSVNGVLYVSGGMQLMICPAGFSGSFTVPAGTRMIATKAFYDCDGITEVTLPEGMWNIGSYAFASCGSLSSISLSPLSMGINAYAFDGCTALTDIYFAGTQSDWDGMMIGGEGNAALTSALLHLVPEDEPEPTLAAPTISVTAFSTAGRDVTIHVTGPDDCDYIDSDMYFYLEGSQGTVTIPGFHFPHAGTYTIQAYAAKEITLDDGSTDWIYSDDAEVEVTLAEPEGGIPALPEAVFSSLEVDYGAEAADLTFTIPGADAVAYLSIWEEGGGWPDEIIEGSTAHPLDALSEPGLWIIRVYGRFQGVWSGTAREYQVRVNALGLLEQPVIRWNGTQLTAKEYTISLDAPLNFTIASEPVDSLWYMVSRVEGEFDDSPVHAEGKYVTYGGIDQNNYSEVLDADSDQTAVTLNLNDYDLMPGVYRLFAFVRKAGMEYNTTAIWIHLAEVGDSILDLPGDLTTIENQAFANLADADAVRIPASVTSIASDAFSGSNITILAPLGSYAEAWAQDPEHAFPVVLE